MTMPGRMLQLLALLQGRREWSGAELAERLEVTDRTVRRDVDRLRELGYPVDGTTGTAGGYRLASGRNLPPLLLDDDEAVAVAVGLTATAGTIAGIEETAVRALAKLRQVLPARLRTRVDAVAAATIAVGPGSATSADADVLGVLAAACRDHELVRFDYSRRDGSSGHRRVEPYRLVTGYGLWYLVAFDPERSDWRTFRVDRITAPTPTHARFSPREPPTDAAAQVRRAIADAPYRHRAVIRVAATVEQVRARLPRLLPARLQPVDEHSCTVTFGADDVQPIVMDLVALGAPFVLDEADDELREQLRAAGQWLLDAGQSAAPPPGSRSRRAPA